jgi:hypothetical protein
MTDYTQTITNAFVVFGSDTTYLWNGFNWGTGYWGTDEDLDLDIGKLVGESSTITASRVFDATHIQSAQTTTISESLSFDVVHTLSAQTITGSHVFDDLSLSDEAGFEYVYPSRTTNLVTIASGTFTKVSDGTDSFSTFAATSTSWNTV